MDGRDAKPPPPNPSMPYREDCWSEGETSILVDAWGDRYLELNRGNLRQKQWQEVADAVNSRPGGLRRPPRTDVQCKNRIDTLKKKYKVEKTKKISDAAASPWPFYSRLEILIGPSVSVKKPPPPPPMPMPMPFSPPPLALPLPSHRKGIPFPAAAAAAAARSADQPKEKCLFRNSFAAAAAAAAVDGESRSCSESSVERERERSGGERRRRGDGVGELARAIERFGEIYEKVEGEKQRQMMELEKERMDFVKGLEFRRMQMFVDTQVQMEKIKRSRRDDDAGERDLLLLFLAL